MGFFSCPKKSDNHWWSEEQWHRKNWTDEEKFRNAALPHHMWDWKQNDRPWPFCKAYRGDNAYGPRASFRDFDYVRGDRKFLHSPPRLVEGRGIARWMTPGDKSVVDVPLLRDYSRTWKPNNLPAIIECAETQKNGHYGELYKFPRSEFLKLYGPSSLQKFSDKSWLKRYPYHISYHRMINRRELLHIPKEETGEDIVWFYRYGWRWDSFDNYYVKRAPYAGFNWN